MAKYIDKITVPIKENGSTTTTTLHLVDGTLASWVRESSKPLYDASEIEYSTTASSGPLSNAQRVGEALDDANDDLILLNNSKPYCVTYGATVNTSELAQAMYNTNRPVFLKVIDGDYRDFNIKYIPITDADGEAEQGEGGLSNLEFSAGNGWTYYYNSNTWTSAYYSNDTKVTNTLDTSKKYYITGTSSSSTNTGTQFFDTGIYATTTAGQLNATTYKVNEQVTLQWNSTDSCLDFIFA